MGYVPNSTCYVYATNMVSTLINVIRNFQTIDAE